MVKQTSMGGVGDSMPCRDAFSIPGWWPRRMWAEVFTVSTGTFTQCTLAQPTPGIHFNLLTADPSASLAFGFFQWRDSSNGPDLLIMGFAQNRKLVLQRGWPRLISSESLAVAEASSAACAPFTGRGNYRKIKYMDCVALPFTCTRPQALAPERSPLFRRFMFI